MLFDRIELEDLAPARLSRDALPPYAYLPGRGPHPIRSPEGHMAAAGSGHSRVVLPAEGPVGAAQADWRAGIDLYNRGYFWEAHERWEGLWQALGRVGDEAVLLKALIQTAAAQIKALEGNRRGVEILAAKSGAALADLARRRPRLMGCDLSAFLATRAVWFARVLGDEACDLRHFPFIRLSEDEA